MGELGDRSEGGRDVAEHDDRADGLAVAIVDRSRRILDRKFLPVASDQDAVGGQVDGPVTAQRPVRQIRDQFVRLRIDDADDHFHRAAKGFGAGPTRQPLSDGVQERDVPGEIRAAYPIADGVERDEGALLERLD